MSSVILGIKIKADGTADVVGDVGKINSALNTTKSNAERTGQAFNSISAAAKSAASVVGGFFAASKFAELGGDILNTNRSMEMLRAQLTALTGSAAGSAQAFKFIQDFAINTPFEIDGLTKAYIGLQNYGIRPTAEVMTAITNQASKLGASQETLSGITTALGQAYAKGKLQAEEMMQLAERGVPVYDILSKALGKSTEQLFEMAKNGELTRDTIDQLIQKMGEMASGGNAAAMDTLNGKISNLSDAWHKFEDTLLSDKSEGVIKGLVSTVTNLITLLDRNLNNSIDAQVAHAQARIDTFKSMGFVGRMLADYTGYDIGTEYNKLDNLNKKKKAADEEARTNKIKQDSAAEVSRTLQWLGEIDATEAGKAEAAAKKRAKAADKSAMAYAKEREAVAAKIAEIERETAMAGLSSEQMARENELHAALAGANQLEADVIRNQKLPAKWAAIDAAQAHAEAMQDELAAAQKQADQYLRLYERRNPKQSQYNDSFTARQYGIIDDQQLARELENISMGLDAVEGKAKDTTDKMSEFSVQAARNMESAFADFLFDPFGKGMDGLVVGFGTAIKRMLAEAASAQLMEALFGKQGKSGGFHWGGLVGAAISGIGRAFGGGSSVDAFGANSSGRIVSGVFANGGIMTDRGPLPLKQYATGGIATGPQLALFGEGRMNEAYVPLPDGRRIPVAMQGGGGTVNNVTIQVQSRKDESPAETGQRVGEAFIRAIAKEEIKTASRPGNTLNQVTKFG